MTIENLTKELYAELKADLKSEIINEIKDEINFIVRKEVENVLIIERGLEASLTTYIHNLCFREIHYLRMLNQGLVKHGENLIVIPNSSNGFVWLNKKDYINFENLFREYSKSGIVNCSFENFESALKFEPIDGSISWNGSGRKKFSYIGLFQLYNTIYDFESLIKNAVVLERFVSFISSTFTFDGQFKTSNDVKKSFNRKYIP
jgi:hypothetical protein